LNSIHHLHFDQNNNLGIFNNRRFHKTEHIERLLYLKHQLVNLVLQHRGIWPKDYLGPEPVQMASDPLDPFKDPPAGSHWHLAPTVRDYFNVMEVAIAKCLDDFNQLFAEVNASFASLDERVQDASFERALQEMREETPIRVLKQHLPDDEYRRLLGVLGG